MRILFFKVSKHGLKSILTIFILFLICVVLHYYILSYILLGYLIFLLYFFRDPDREVPKISNVILSPADGKVVFLGEVFEDRFLKTEVKKISIFMSPFNVHVNRAPVAGKVLGVYYNKGKFLPAFVEKASLDNEQNAILFEEEYKKDKVMIVQIAGIFARRIVCEVKEGDSICLGQKVGMIKLGSRVDIYFPKHCAFNVSINDKVTAGRTILASF